MGLAEVIVENLPKHVDKSTLTAVFGCHGRVISASIRPLDSATANVHEKTGILSYSSIAEAQRAVSALNGAFLEGNTIRVCVSQGPKGGQDSDGRQTRSTLIVGRKRERPTAVAGQSTLQTKGAGSKSKDDSAGKAARRDIPRENSADKFLSEGKKEHVEASVAPTANGVKATTSKKGENLSLEVQNPVKYSGVCAKFLAGKCRRTTCRFQHVKPEVKADKHTKKVTCFNFAAGSCKWGDKCRFLHQAARQGASPASVVQADNGVELSNETPKRDETDGELDSMSSDERPETDSFVPVPRFGLASYSQETTPEGQEAIKIGECKTEASKAESARSEEEDMSPQSLHVEARQPHRGPEDSCERLSSCASKHSIVYKIEQYAENSSTEPLHLSASLTSFERLLAHKTAEGLGLKHVSIGEGPEKHLVVEKKAMRQTKAHAGGLDKRLVQSKKQKSWSKSKQLKQKLE